jgi:hypothetical protein
MTRREILEWLDSPGAIVIAPNENRSHRNTLPVTKFCNDDRANVLAPAL